jgi:hypothetical protein
MTRNGIDQSMLTAVTFLLAVAGYLALTLAAVIGPRRRLIRGCAVIVVAHVLLVWWLRYDWAISEATRHGYAGFVVFHTALAAILWAAIAPEALARRLVRAAFVIVSIGALGAVFRYDVVRPYRVPVVLCAVAGSIGIVREASRNRPDANSLKEAGP